LLLILLLLAARLLAALLGKHPLALLAAVAAGTRDFCARPGGLFTLASPPSSLPAAGSGSSTTA
jgi:hypothetical protein